MDLNKLAEPFDTSLISWRVGATTKDKSKGIALAYIDARDVMQRLDDVCGMGNWQDRYPFKGCCEIGIKIDSEWIWKANGAGETDYEGEKGQFSDAFKRAGVLWKIGRYLYDVENTWVPIKQQGKSYVIADPNSSVLANALKKAANGIRATRVIPMEKTGNRDIDYKHKEWMDWLVAYPKFPNATTAILEKGWYKINDDPLFNQLTPEMFEVMQDQYSSSMEQIERKK